MNRRPNRLLSRECSPIRHPQVEASGLEQEEQELAVRVERVVVLEQAVLKRPE